MKLSLKEESIEIISENEVEKVYLKNILNNNLSIQEFTEYIDGQPFTPTEKYYGLKIIKREIAYAKPAKE